MNEYMEKKTRLSMIAVVLCCAIVICGCDSDEDTIQDNSAFMGTFSGELTATQGGAVETDNDIAIIGSDVALRDADTDDYLYIPGTGNTASWTTVETDGGVTEFSEWTVSISGSTITWEQDSSVSTGSSYSMEIVLVFSADYNTATVQVSVNSSDVGPLVESGTFTRN